MQIIDGQSVHPAVAVAYGKLAAAFKAATGKELRVSSGHRTTAEQTALFLSRYRLQSTGGGTYGDIRWWQGRRYVRVSAAGTVAVPGTSLHESLRALDVRDTGADAGVTVAGTVRANWLRANAPRFEFNPRGYNFKEPWHIEYTGSLTAPAGGGITPILDKEEDDMEPKIIGHKNEEIAILAPWLPNGYLVAKVGTEVAVGWARLYSPTKDSLVPMYDRAAYLGMIAGAKALAQGYQAAHPKTAAAIPFDYAELGKALALAVSANAPVPSAQQIAKAVNDDAAERLRN